MPKTLNSRCKELIASLIEYFEKERDNNGPLLPLTAVRERVAAALKLSRTTVSSISQTTKSNELLTSPPKKRSYKKRVVNTELLNTSDIRNTIYEMYERKEHITLSSLEIKLKDKQLFNGSRMSLCRLLKEIGFKFLKDKPRRGLMELSHISVKRAEFLRTYQKQKYAGIYQFVFIDETWIFQNGSVSRSWQDHSKRSVKSLKTDGKRYIILHAGNVNGFIEGAEAIFCSKTNMMDYHGEMNQINFVLWFENQLLKNVSEPSLIIMDNAPYHSMLLNKIPNASWNKDNIREWLTNNKLPFDDMMFKSELLHIVAQNKPPPKYLIDDLAQQYGHQVLRLPPYHCIFNPIELIWGIAKTYYNRHIGRDGHSEKDSLNMWKEALQTVTPQIWKNSIAHTETEIKKWYDREHILERMEILPVIIDPNEDSDTSSSDESD